MDLIDRRGQLAGTLHRSACCLAALLTVSAGTAAGAATYTVTDIVMEGLANPRGMTVGPDGGLYVAEAGRGGAGASIPSGDGQDVFYGTTGAISRSLGGTQERIVTGLPSLAPEGGFGATGLHDVDFAPDGALYGVLGFGADPSLRDDLAGQPGAGLLGQLVSLAGGVPAPVADLAAYERDADPDGVEPNSNPYGLVATGSGFVVADAGGNDLLDVGADGTVETRAVLPPAPNPLPFGPPVYQAVPTGLARGMADDVVTVLLTGFPFPPGAAEVLSVTPSGAVDLLAGGFTNLIDVAVGAEGEIYALELDSDSLVNPGSVGALWRIGADGTRSLLFDGLESPTGLAVGPDGRLFVTENGLSPTDGRVVELSPAPVPLPAALPALLGGLACFGWIGRRRSRR